jgi:uncharacterized protein YaeQ
MTPEQCRAARAWLRISIDELASAAGVSTANVRDFELRRLSRVSADAMQDVLLRRGVIFIGDRGIVVNKGKRISQKRLEIEK